MNNITTYIKPRVNTVLKSNEIAREVRISNFADACNTLPVRKGSKLLP